jgi:hypothetical protein
MRTQVRGENGRRAGKRAVVQSRNKQIPTDVNITPLRCRMNSECRPDNCQSVLQADHVACSAVSAPCRFDQPLQTAAAPPSSPSLARVSRAPTPTAWGQSRRWRSKGTVGQTRAHRRRGGTPLCTRTEYVKSILSCASFLCRAPAVCLPAWPTPRSFLPHSRSRPLEPSRAQCKNNNRQGGKPYGSN